MENIRPPASQEEQRPAAPLEIPVDSIMPPIPGVEFTPPVGDEPPVDTKDASAPIDVHPVKHTPKPWFGPTERQENVFSWDIPRSKGKAGQNGW